jgi:ketosteroid isomerase-like protein
MYRAIVAARVRRAWSDLQQHNTDAVLTQFAAHFEHSFAGEHALGGERHTREAQAAWFARLFRLFPDIQFSVRDVLVAGWPWRTRVVVVVDVSLPSEPAYRNIVIQRLELRWGRITRIANLEDTQRLADLLARRAAEGNAEATSTPITDRPLPAPTPQAEVNDPVAT